MALQFGRDICGDLANAEQREWLVTNGIGGYACGTLAGLLTRHYHGLLVAALKPPLGRTLLVTKLDETLHYDQQSYGLQADRWADGSLSGHGYHRIERFALEGTVPVWRYAVADALLEKRIWMQRGANTTYVQYKLQRGQSPLRLTAKALVNYRPHHNSTRGQDWQMQVDTVAKGVQITAFPEAVPIYVLSQDGQPTPHHTWYYGYHLAIEQYRGIDPTDDHLHAATFTFDLEPGQSCTLVATTDAAAQLDGQAAYQEQQQTAQQLLQQWHGADYLPTQNAPAWVEQLVLAADQFIVDRPLTDDPAGKTVIAGYPWFGDWGRDTMISLPGLAIATGRTELARPILRTFAYYLDQGMLPNMFPEAGEVPGYNTVDATLWYFEAIRLYHDATQDEALLQELFPALAEIIRWHQQGTRYGIHLDTDGLIYAGEPDVQLTWMDAKVDDWVVTPRQGKAIEVNALWYNALRIMADFAETLGQPATEYQRLAEQTRQGFQRFWQPDLGYCYDVLDTPQGDNADLRPNQIFAVALPASPQWSSPLSPAQQKAVVDVVAQQLLTSHGLRSLSPNHADYHSHYGGDRYQRDGAYHQGTVWGWLIGPFVQAHLKVYRHPAIAHQLLEPMADHLRSGCVGTLSEIFDGAPPMTPRGAFAQAWTVAEVLRAWITLQSFAADEPE
jgi:predicted glycogen debranching enzyme